MCPDSTKRIGFVASSHMTAEWFWPCKRYYPLLCSWYWCHIVPCIPWILVRILIVPPLSFSHALSRGQIEINGHSKKRHIIMTWWRQAMSSHYLPRAFSLHTIRAYYFTRSRVIQRYVSGICLMRSLVSFAKLACGTHWIWLRSQRFTARQTFGTNPCIYLPPVGVSPSLMQM